MNTRILLLLVLLGMPCPRILAAIQVGYVERTISVTSPNYSLDFAIAWSCDPYPVFSQPGRIELQDSHGTVALLFIGSVSQASGPNFSLTGGGSVSGTSFWMYRYADDGSPADGSFQGTWNVTGLAPGNYTLRIFSYTSYDFLRPGSTVWTNTSVTATYPTAGANVPPTIAWTSAPATAASGQGYTVSAHAHDADGNLAQVNVWKNGQPFAFAGGGNGTDGDSGNPTSDTGPQTITFTAQAVDATGATSPLITQVVTINAPVNTPPTVTLLSPGAQTVVAGTTLTLSSHATDSDGNISGHNLDIQRPAGDWNFQGGFATGEPYQGGPVGSGADSTRSASFTFTDVGTYVVRSAANDGSGWVQSATVAITVVAPPPVQFALSTSAGSGGSVSAGGTFNAGTSATVTAIPDGTHDFAGWSGDATGTANPVGIVMDRNKAVQANFVLKTFTLTTSAMTGGSITPGGSYPYGTTITLSATADATHYFSGWTGDASGAAPSIGVLVDRAKSVQAQFAPKAAQSISFTVPGAQRVGTTLTLAASTSSGLPVSFVILSGPAMLSGNQLKVIGPGTITLQAIQPGDSYTLAAPPVTGTFNAAVAAVLKYMPSGRTWLQGTASAGTAPFVLQ